MRSVTEFWSYLLVRGIEAKTALTAEGKTAEELQAAIGEKFKFEGDKLKHFLNAIEVASQNMEKLSRVAVVSLAEGETAPPKAVKIEEFCYVPDFQEAPKPLNMQKADPKGGGKGRKGGSRDGKPKGSPWGLSPEEKAAKTGGKSSGKPNPGT